MQIKLMGTFILLIAAKMGKNVVIYQNVILGSNMKYNKITEKWENIGFQLLMKYV